MIPSATLPASSPTLGPPAATKILVGLYLLLAPVFSIQATERLSVELQDLIVQLLDNYSDMV